MQAKVQTFIETLIKDYGSLYKPRTDYSDFQRLWLDNIRSAAETASKSTPVKKVQPSTSASIWRDIHNDVQKVIEPNQKETNFMPDDALMRMCGAEICRMIKLRKNSLKRFKKEVLELRQTKTNCVFSNRDVYQA